MPEPQEPQPLPESDTAFLARIQASVIRHRKVLNRLEPHLGCVICRTTLEDDGRHCPVCDVERLPEGKNQK